MKHSPTPESTTEHLQKYSSFQSKQEASKVSLDPLERMKQVQDEWLSGVGEEFCLKTLKQLHQQSIDASAGSSTFLPPEEVEQKIRETPILGWVEYTNHLPQKDLVKAAEQYFKKIEVLDKTTQLEVDVYDQDLSNGYFCYVGHGTTELFTSALKSIKKHPNDVVIITDPTYGLFIPPLLEESKGVEILKINEENNYKPDPKALTNLIETTNAKLQNTYLIEVKIIAAFLSAFFQVNEKFLSKLDEIDLTQKCDALKYMLISSQAKPETLDQAVSVFNQTLNKYLKKIPSEVAPYWQNKLSLSYCPRVRGYFHINPQMPLGTICSQSDIDSLADSLSHFPDITVIDDLTYYDLCLSQKTRPGTFAKSQLKNKTLTLYSISKQFALAGVRTGIAIGPQNIIQPIAKHSFNSVNTPSVFTSEAAFQIFKMDHKKREKYLLETNEEYAFRRDFAIALLKGIEHIGNAEHQEKIKATLKELKISARQQTLLLQGIKGITFPVIPEAGFFLLIDFSHYKDQYISSTQLQTSRDFRNAFYSLADLNTLPGEMMLHFDKPILRFSFSLTPKDILESVYRFKNVLSLCRPEPELTASDKASPTVEKVKKLSPATRTVRHDKGSQKVITREDKKIDTEAKDSYSPAILNAFNQHKKEKKKTPVQANDSKRKQTRVKRKIKPNTRYAGETYV
ncbi:MAG: hypothetical protein BGO43_03085 [Gammaproteobacteria bacterium 39-13]|nr:aminotransferase class I/II-fold pyridoxal phosphate-dependent enzyme [Gammaproteobacteria bacterium]OJV86987.1 MAG: hypothetical protein BGO43_03085 [Gammaproteobacteria bacterium 39-13]